MPTLVNEGVSILDPTVFYHVFYCMPHFASSAILNSFSPFEMCESAAFWQ